MIKIPQAALDKLSGATEEALRGWVARNAEKLSIKDMAPIEAASKEEILDWLKGKPLPAPKVSEEAAYAPSGRPLPSPAIRSAAEALDGAFRDFLSEFNLVPYTRVYQSLRAYRNAPAAAAYMTGYVETGPTGEEFGPLVKEKCKSPEWAALFKQFQTVKADARKHIAGLPPKPEAGDDPAAEAEAAKNRLWDEAGIDPAELDDDRLWLFHGEPGGGKTTAATAMFPDAEVWPCSEKDTADKVFAGLDFGEDGKPRFLDTALKRAMVEGKTVILDEANLWPVETMATLQTATAAGTWKLTPPCGGKIEIKPGFRVVMTMNLVRNGIRFPVPEAIRDRATVIKEFSLAPGVALLRALGFEA